jgi:hypothetical protein
MDEARADLLSPILTTAQRLGYGRTFSIVVIVIPDRGRLGGGRRDNLGLW